MFGKEPSPYGHAARKANKRYQADLQAGKQASRRMEFESGKQRDAEWEGYQAEHGTTSKFAEPGNPRSLKYHPAYQELESQHRDRVGEIYKATRDVVNNSYKKNINPKSNGLWEEPALAHAREDSLNRQQFG